VPGDNTKVRILLCKQGGRGSNPLTSTNFSALTIYLKKLN